MAKTVIGLFDNFSDAQGAVKALADDGFARDDISLMRRDERGEVAERRATDADSGVSGAAAGAGIGAVLGGIGGLLVGLGALAIPGVGPVIAAGPLASALVGAGVGAAAGGLIGALTDLGVPEEEAGYYAEGVRRGGTLVAVRTDERGADRAAAILDRFNPVDIDERATSWRQEGWTGYDPKAEPYTEDRITRERETYRTVDREDRELAGAKGGTTLPVVEEEVRIGKRETERGGVRVRSYVREEPVEEQVRLRDEHVHVERRPVDRVVDAGAVEGAFREGTIEVSEVHEEAVVDKQARVVEEVVVSKDVDERVETVRDTVRRTDVDVEEVGGTGRTTRARSFEEYDADFRRHYDTSFRNTGHDYNTYQPAYRYGYTLGTDERYSRRDWREFEPDVRRSWEERNPGTWERFKDAVHHGWAQVTGRR